MAWEPSTAVLLHLAPCAQCSTSGRVFHNAPPSEGNLALPGAHPASPPPEPAAHAVGSGGVTTGLLVAFELADNPNAPLGYTWKLYFGCEL